jgi:hypothetical protein
MPIKPHGKTSENIIKSIPGALLRDIVILEKETRIMHKLTICEIEKRSL